MVFYCKCSQIDVASQLTIILSSSQNQHGIDALSYQNGDVHIGQTTFGVLTVHRQDHECEHFLTHTKHLFFTYIGFTWALNHDYINWEFI